MKTAHLIKKTHLFEPDEYVCSVCGYTAAEPFGVCPNCGEPLFGEKSDLNWVDEAAMFDILLGG